MSKMTKKVIACVLSMLMVITSVPFVAFAEDSAIDEAIASYESKMNGTVYTNMSAAYTAYITAVKARDAVNYGGRTDIDLDALASDLSTKTAAMKVYTPFFSTVTPSFHGDDLSAFSGTAYSNLLYSPQVDDPTATVSNSNSNLDYELFYAPTVLAYDGTTQLKMPVMVSAKLTYQKDRYLYGCYPITAGENYADHPDLALAGLWYTGKNDTGHADGLNDGSWSFKDQLEANLQTFGYNNATGYGPNQSTERRSQYLPHSGTLFWWSGKFFYGANIMNVNPTFAEGEYLKTYQPHWYICGSDQANSANDLTVFRGSNEINVINYKALTDAISNSSYTSVLANITKYNKDYSDMLAMLGAYATATSFNINSYYFEDSAKITECADAIKSICNTLASKASALTVSDMSDYNHLKNAIDSYRDADNTSGKYTPETWSAFTTAQNKAVAAMANVYENGYVDKYNGTDVSALAESLDFILDKSGDCGSQANYTYNSETGEVLIAGTGDMTDFEFLGKDSPFAGSTKITSIEIAEGITSIGDYAFYGCTNLETVILPETVTSVGVSAFEDCSSLTTIIVPAGAVYDENAFAGCSSLETVEFGSGAIAAKSIDDHNAPWYQPTVKTLVLTSGVTSIGENAFNGATNIEHLTVNCDIPINPNSNTNAFAGMTSLKYITIAKGATGTMIDWRDYYRRTPWYGNRNNLEMHITIESGVQNISAYAFFECANIEDVAIPATVKSIGERAFYGCSALDDVYIYDEDCEIYDSAFTFHELTKIHGYDISTAHSYADKYNRDFVLIGEHVHSYKSVVTAPTCTAQGYTTYTCETCGDTYVNNYTEALGHDYNPSSVVTPTCQHGGYTINVCSRCNATTNTNETPAIDHNYKAGLVVEPNCQHGGYTVFTCTMCGATENRDQTPVTSHSYTATEVVTANCQHGGYTVYTCTVCGNSYQGDATPQAEHNYTIFDSVSPTCTAGGYLKVTCSECGHSYKTNEVDPLGHDYVVNGDIARASFTTEGHMPVKCTRCLDTTNKRISCPTAKLAKTAYTYTGKAIAPAVVLTDGDGNEIPADQYKVTYQGARVKVGTYKVTVTFNADAEYYYGSTTLSFKINPKGTALSKVTSGTKTLTATWKKQTSQTKGYQIQVATDSKFKKNAKTVTIKNTKTLKTTIKKLKYNTKYYVRVRTYGTVGKTNYYSTWSKAKTIKVKPVIGNASISKLTAGKKQFTAKWKKVKSVTGYEVQYSTSSKMSKAKTVKVNSAKTTSAKVTKLKAKKTYYVRIRAVKKVGKKTYYGNWSKVKSIKTK